MSSFIYGIDFGTSNSVLSILDTNKKEIVKTFRQSSLLYFKDNKQFFVGNESIQQYLTNNMNGRLLKSIKTLLPQSSFSFTYIFGKKFFAEDLVALVLSFLKNEADQFLGEDIKEVVLGRPVVFSEDPVKDKLAENRLLSAAKKAGFEKIWFQYEPIGAGFLYEQSIPKPETVLIGDFGGGTSDFTLMRLDKNNSTQKDRKCDIIKTGGIHIGGDDFDAAIMWNKLVPFFGYGIKYESFGKMLDLPVHVFRTLCEWEQMAFLKEGKIRKQLDTYYLYTNKNVALERLMSLIDNNLGFALFQTIEKSKIELSEKEKTEIHFNQSNINIQEVLEHEEFKRFTDQDIEKIDAFLENFLKSTTTPVDKVFLTGGTSSLKGILELFRKRFSPEKIFSGDNFNSVAEGLAWSFYSIK